MPDPTKKKDTKKVSYTPAADEGYNHDPKVASLKPPPYSRKRKVTPIKSPGDFGSWDGPAFRQSEDFDPKKHIVNGEGEVGKYEDQMGTLRFLPYSFKGNDDMNSSAHGAYGSAALLNYHKNIISSDDQDVSRSIDFDFNFLKAEGGIDFDASSHFKIGGGLSLFDIALRGEQKYKSIPGRDNSFDLSFGLGEGTTAGIQWGDTDGDGYPNWGATIPLLPSGIGLEFETEDPFRDLLLGAINPYMAMTLAPTKNLTEQVNLQIEKNFTAAGEQIKSWSDDTFELQFGFSKEELMAKMTGAKAAKKAQAFSQINKKMESKKENAKKQGPKGGLASAAGSKSAKMGGLAAAARQSKVGKKQKKKK